MNAEQATVLPRKPDLAPARRFDVDVFLRLMIAGLILVPLEVAFFPWWFWCSVALWAPAYLTLPLMVKVVPKAHVAHAFTDWWLGAVCLLQVVIYAVLLSLRFRHYRKMQLALAVLHGGCAITVYYFLYSIFQD